MGNLTHHNIEWYCGTNNQVFSDKQLSNINYLIPLSKRPGNRQNGCSLLGFVLHLFVTLCIYVWHSLNLLNESNYRDEGQRF